MNKPLSLQGLVVAKSGSKETIIEETDTTKSTKGATSYGKNNYECTGIICTDGISLPKAYELVKTPGFPTIRIRAGLLIEAYKEWLIRTSTYY